MGVEDAARQGVREAQEWLRTGTTPTRPQWVEQPPFDPPPGWNTRTTVRLSEDEEGHLHDKRGRFAPKGGGDTGASTAKIKTPTATAKKDADASKDAEKLDAAVSKMRQTPKGRVTLRRGHALAVKVRDNIAKGVHAALDALDEESMGGVSLIAGGLKGKDPVAVAAGVSRLVSAVFQDVHEEVWENALSEHSLPGAHAIGAVAAKGAAKAEQGLLQAMAWTWGKLKGGDKTRLSLDDADNLTDADRRLLRSLAAVTAQALGDIYRAAGRDKVHFDLDAIEQRLAQRLRHESIASANAATKPITTSPS